jgi:hypothetical protein
MSANGLYDRSPAQRRAMQRLAILGVVCLLLAAVAGPVAVHRLSATMPARKLPESVPAAVASQDQVRAVVVELHSVEADRPYEQLVDDVADVGAEAVCFSLPAWQGDYASSSVFIEYRTRPTDERLTQLVNLAHQRGLKVIVMPVLKLDQPRPGDWAGTISPTNLNDWWNDYENTILFYADLARRAGAEVFAIGAQLVASEEQEQAGRWRSLARKVRNRYGGYVCYVADPRTCQQIPWWGNLDLLAVTAAFGTGSDGKVALEALLASPAPAGEAVRAFQASIRRPLVYVLAGPTQALRQAAGASRTATRSARQP